MRLALLVALGSAAAVLASWPRDANAGIFLGAQLDAGQGIGMPPAARPEGIGFLGTFGYRIGIGPVFLQPEAQGGYTLFPADSRDVIHVARALGGLRFGKQGMIEPSIFGHAGAGWLGSDTTGIACDAGLALAFKLVPFFSFGAQAAYSVVTLTTGGAATKWVEYGLHVAIEL